MDLDSDSSNHGAVSPSVGSGALKRMRKAVESDSSDNEATTSAPVSTAPVVSAPVVSLSSADTAAVVEPANAKPNDVTNLALPSAVTAPAKPTAPAQAAGTAKAKTVASSGSSKPLHPFFAAKAKAAVPATLTSSTSASDSTDPAASSPAGVGATTTPSTAPNATAGAKRKLEDDHAAMASSVPVSTSSSSSSSTSAAASAAPSNVTASIALGDDSSESEAASSDDDDDGSSSSASFHPVKSAGWKGGPGQAVPYSALVAVFQQIEATTKRIAITDFLTSFFRSLIAVAPDDLLPALYLCSNAIAPAYANLELGVGDSLLMKALSEATGRQTKDIKAEAETKGDLGDVAEASRAKQKTLFGGGASSALTIRGVFAAYKSIAQESGKSSQDKKVGAIKRLLVAAQGAEAKYIVRGMQGKLRIGLAQQTVLVALAHAFVLTPPIPAGTPVPKRGEVHNPPGRSSSSSYPPVLLSTARRADLPGRLERGSVLLKQVYSELPSYDAVVPAMLKGGLEGARASCQLVPGVPVTPMLAKPTKGIREVLERFEGIPFTCEWKYDGERAQVHVMEDGSVKIFSRNSEDTTSKYPDVGLALKMAMGRIPSEPIYPTTGPAAASAAASAGAGAAAAEGAASAPLAPFFSPAGEAAASSSSSSSAGPRVPVSSCVLDGEAVAYDRDRGVLLPFQVLSTRARKDASLENIKVQVIFVAFDLLYLNGKSLLHSPLTERRSHLRSAFTEVTGRFAFAQASESTDTEEIQTFLNESVKGGCEGLMVKVMSGAESVYEPSKRSLNWLKLKKDYMDGLTDSFDLVPVGAWKGKGKRTGVFGAYLLACYDPDNDEYQTVCKVGTGFSEEMLATLSSVFNDKEDCIVANKPRNVVVGDGLSDADVWFSPEESEVWEVMAADLSISPVHMGAVGKADPSKGIGLRFPRFLRRRDLADKGPTDATTSSQVLDMYRNQATVQGGGGGGGMDDDDDDMF